MSDTIVMTIEVFEAAYGWLPADTRTALYDLYVTHGADSMWDMLRVDERYEQWFPGNLTEDGRPRYSEDSYAAVRAGYEDVLRSVGITNMDVMQNLITDQISGDVAVTEFSDRVNEQYDRVVSASEGVRSYYASTYGVELTDAGLLGAALDPSVGDAILEGRIESAEVGGTFGSHGFFMDSARVDELVAEGMDLNSARSLGSEAAHLVPILDMLAKRHNNPDDDFDIEEFLASEFFADPRENLRMRRLMQAERSQFAATGSFTQTEQGLTGLTQQ